MFEPDKDQKKVIEFFGGTALVLAAPGCGKTEILSHRILEAHSRFGVPYSQMLCLTFTNRASREMKDRVGHTINDDTSELFIGNLHRFCIRFLYLNQLVPIDTGIIDDTDQKDIIQELAEKQGLGTLKPWEVSAVLGQACAMRERKGNIPFRAHSDKGPFGYAEPLATDYIKFLRSNRLIDYDDILYFTYSSLANESGRSKLSNASYSWIQVDEIQDLNPLQLAIIELLAAPEATMVFLGDERQSIFSFMGTKRESLEHIRKLCGENVFFLNHNYRAPIYLLDMLNDYAEDILKMDFRRLPTSSNNSNESNALQCIECYDSDEQRGVIAGVVKRINSISPEDSIGILVRTNNEALEVSRELFKSEVPHLAVTNKDIFKSIGFKTVLSHFAVINVDTAFTDWSRIFFQTKVLPKLSLCRQCVSKMRKIGVTPRDLLVYDKSTYILEYLKAFANREIIVFDTETTGTDVYNDDIIQIAACKLKKSEIVPGSELNIMIRTDKSIPPTLSNGLENPMVKEYAYRESLETGHPAALLSPQEAFNIFLNYIGTSDLLGHNIKFDIDMVKNNLRRRCHGLYYSDRVCWDTLSLARRLDPNLRRHNLQTMIEVYGLEAVNSHNALDDVYATALLAGKLYEKALQLRGDHRAFISLDITDAIRERLRKFYLPLYNHTIELLESTDSSLTDEFRWIHQTMLKEGYIEPIPRLEEMMKLYDRVVIDKEKEPTLGLQLSNRLHDLRTFNEADLYQNGIIDCKVHIMTIHKAKGLQFDNVVLPDISKDIFPRFNSRHPEEDARLLYVGLSRARKRVILTFVGKISPFISSHPHIEEHFTFMPLREKERLLGRRRHN